jgi:hypothetical protein
MFYVLRFAEPQGSSFTIPTTFAGFKVCNMGLSARLFSREGFCPPSHFYRRAFVLPAIFMGRLLIALLFLDGIAFSGRAFVLHSGNISSYTLKCIKIMWLIYAFYLF